MNEIDWKDRICAHRGVASQAPENTMAAIKRVKQTGCNWTEVDVQLTSDGIPVIFHDDMLERCTNGEGLLAETSFDVLKDLDAGRYFSEAFCGERVPELKALLAYAKESGLKLNIEIKTYPDTDVQRLCVAVSETIVRSDISLSQLIFSSFNMDALAACKELLPLVPRAVLFERVPDKWRDYLYLEPAFFNCDYRYLTKNIFDSVHGAGVKIQGYSTENPEDVAQLWEWGMMRLITRSPQRFL